MNPPSSPIDSPEYPADLRSVAQLLDFLQTGGPTAMDCRELLEVIARYVDLEAVGGHPAEWMPCVDLHLEDCDHCQELYEVLRLLSHQLPSMDQELEGVWEEVRRQAGAGAETGPG